MGFKATYRLMQVKSIAECSKWSILQYFRPSLSYQLSLRPLFYLFLSARFTQVLLYISHFFQSTCIQNLMALYISEHFVAMPVGTRLAPVSDVSVIFSKSFDVSHNTHRLITGPFCKLKKAASMDEGATTTAITRGGPFSGSIKRTKSLRVCVIA